MGEDRARARTLEAALPWRSFVALGDSVTEGVGDPVSRRGLRGWADRLAAGLQELGPDLEYVKLARRGLTTRQIRDTQLERAVELRPDLASLITGMNDAIRPTFEPEVVRQPLEEMLDALSGVGTLALLATLPDVTRILPLPEPRKVAFRRRLETLNDVVRETAARRPETTVFVDAAEMPGELRRANWSIDQLHPNSRGHLLIARAFAERLGERAGVEIPLPDLEDVPIAGRESFRHAQWVLLNSWVPEARRLAARLLAR